MKLMFIEEVGFLAHRPQGLFCLDVGEGVANAVKENKKIVLIGLGINSYYAEKYLEKERIDIFAYADNSLVRQRYLYKGKKVYSPYELFERKDIYYIVCVPEKNIAGERIQLMLNGVGDHYSIIFPTLFHDFSYENIRIHENVMLGINFLAFHNKNSYNALPYIGFSKSNGEELGIINYLTKCTTFSHPGWLWIRQFLEINSKAKIVDIGPGFGLLDYTFLALYSLIDVTFLNLGDSLEGDIKTLFDQGLESICQKFIGRTRICWGQVERDFDFDTTYDLIIMTEVFEHFACNPIITLKKIIKVMNKGGRMLLTTPNWGKISTYKSYKNIPNQSEMTDEEYINLIETLNYDHVYQYSYDELIEIFEMCDLAIEKYELSECNNHNFWLKKY